MALKILLFVCFFPLLPILYGLLRNDAKPKKNILLGVTLSFTARADERVKRLCGNYRRRLLVAFLLLLPLPVAVLFIPWVSVAFTADMVWMLAVVAVLYGMYIGAHKRLRRLKRDNAWEEWEQPRATVDVRVAAQPPKRLSAAWFLPPLLLSLIPVIVTAVTARDDAEFGWMLFGYGTNALLTACFGFFHRIIYRQRSEIVDDDSDLSAVLTQVRRYNWSKCSLIIAWLTGVYSLLFWLTIHRPMALLIATGLYTVALLYVVLRVEFVTRGAQQRLTADSGQGYYTDDDAHWIYGLFYYNPHDKHVMINERVGVGTTINLARPIGKVTAVFGLLIAVAMPFLGIWMIAEEFAPVAAAVEDGQLVVTHNGTALAVDLAQITAVERLDALPPHRKIVGTGMDSVLKGSFDVEGLGRSQLCLDPRAGPFLIVRVGEDPYLIGTSNGAETAALYDRLATLTLVNRGQHR